MARFVRFVVYQRVGEDRRRLGLFSAAYHLRDRGMLYRPERDALQELLAWFGTALPIPPGPIPPEASFWYVEASLPCRRMWELAHLLEECGYTVELVTAKFVGRIVYQDEHQVAAIPRGKG